MLIMAMEETTEMFTTRDLSGLATQYLNFRSANGLYAGSTNCTAYFCIQQL